MTWIQVGNLDAPVEEWTVGGTALTSLMDVERIHGMVNLSLLFLCSCMFISRVLGIPSDHWLSKNNDNYL